METKTIQLFKVFMSQDVIEPLNDVILSGFITQGPNVDKFEDKLKEYFNNNHVLTLNSATSGLTLALRLLLNEEVIAKIRRARAKTLEYLFFYEGHGPSFLDFNEVARQQLAKEFVK